MSGLSPTNLSYGQAKSAAKPCSSAKTVRTAADRNAEASARFATLRKSMQFAMLDLKSIALLNRGAGADIACSSSAR
jgi:hypothetical protein